MAYIKVILAKTNITAKINKQTKNRKLFIPLHCRQHVLSICVVPQSHQFSPDLVSYLLIFFSHQFSCPNNLEQGASHLFWQVAFSML